MSGKFFSGLPDSMLRGTSNRPNRMESQLFWPDEHKSESVNNSNNTTPSKRATKPEPTEEVQYYNDKNQAATPSSKELYSQHQTSKIEFNYADDNDGGEKHSGVRNNKQNFKSSAQEKNTNITNNHNNRMGFHDNSAKLNALKSSIGFYDYPDESRNSKVTTTRSAIRHNETSSIQNDSTHTNTKYQQQDYNQNERRAIDQINSETSKKRAEENVLKCKMNNDLYDLDGRKKVNNLNVNTNKFNNSSNEYSVNKNSRTIEETRNGGGGDYVIPIKIRNETTHSSSQSSYNSQQQQHQPSHLNSQQYQNSHNVPISLDRDYNLGRSSRGCPQKSYNNITPLYSEQEQSPVIHAKSRAHDHLKSNIFFQNNSNNTSPTMTTTTTTTTTTTRQHRPLSVRDSAVCRVGVGLPDM
jgi:hypothetical protein